MTKLTEERIGELVDHFYAKVRVDPALGDLFNAAVDDWPDHLVRLRAFWASVMLGTASYKGSPMQVHMRHAKAIEPAMFGRWLQLWRETAAERLSEGEAAAIVAKAERIAESLQLGLFFRIDGAPERTVAA